MPLSTAPIGGPYDAHFIAMSMRVFTIIFALADASIADFAYAGFLFGCIEDLPRDFCRIDLLD